MEKSTNQGRGVRVLPPQGPVSTKPRAVPPKEKPEIKQEIKKEDK